MFALLVREKASRRLADWAPLAAGFVAAGLVAWLSRPAPALQSLSWLGVCVLATRYVLAVVLTGSAVYWASSAILVRGRALNVPAFLTAIVWLSPLTLFLSHKSIWAAAMSVAFVSRTTKLMRFPKVALNNRENLTSVPTIGALCCAICMQGGVLTAFLGRPVASATFLGMGSVILAWRSNKFRNPSEPKSNLRTLLLVVVATTFTVAALVRYVRIGGAGDEAAGAGRSSAEQSDASPKSSTVLFNGTYKGVILFPESTPHAVLVPPLPLMKRDLFTKSRSNPLSIPFDGAYWLFRAPDRQPPRNSFTARGSPLTLAFRSNDLRTLSMEAHQNFGTLIDLNCCVGIQLAIRNADPYAGLITVELILTNTRLADRPSLSLGKANVTSKLHSRPGHDHAPPVPEILNFAVPSAPALHEFDEAAILFHRQIAANRSANIAIDRFILISKGL